MEQNTKKLCIIIFSVLVVQFLCRYYSKYFVYGNGFHALIFVLRFGVPLVVVPLFLKTSWSSLGVCLPKISKTGLLWLAGVLILVPLCLYSIRLNPAYQNYYHTYARSSAAVYTRFAVFTFSTLLGWEFLHRGFLLFSLKNLLAGEGTASPKNRLSSQTAAVLALLIVALCETLYHFIKPDMEAFGMLVGSPVLSAIALRTKSILIPLFIHLYVEAWFILYIAG